MHAHIHTLCTYLSLHAKWTHMLTNIYIYMHINTPVYIHKFTNVLRFMNAHLFTHMHIHIHSHSCKYKKLPPIFSMHTCVVTQTHTHTAWIWTWWRGNARLCSWSCIPYSTSPLAPPGKSRAQRVPHLPCMAGRHDLVPREIFLPLPSAWALLWQETCIPVSE